VSTRAFSFAISYDIDGGMQMGLERVPSGAVMRMS
jgi:hypothetical protein